MCLRVRQQLVYVDAHFTDFVRVVTEDEEKGEEGAVLFRKVLVVSGVAKLSARLTLLLTHKECNASLC